MNVKGKKTELINNTTHEENAIEIISRIFILSIGATTLLLLFSSCSNLSVFARGEFTYLESIGIIFAYLTLFSALMFFLPKVFFTLRTTPQLLKNIIFVGIVGVNVCCMMLVITFIWIRYDVKTHCEEAKNEYGGNCVMALSKQLEDINQSFKARNSAIWTLGQLADKNSIPILKKYYTGTIPKREPLNITLSQYELRKAITWCEKGNITRWMYKGF